MKTKCKCNICKARDATSKGGIWRVGLAFQHSQHWVGMPSAIQRYSGIEHDWIIDIRAPPRPPGTWIKELPAFVLFSNHVVLGVRKPLQHFCTMFKNQVFTRFFWVKRRQWANTAIYKVSWLKYRYLQILSDMHATHFVNSGVFSHSISSSFRSKLTSPKHWF